MKQHSQEKLNNMKEHISQHKKTYGLAALTVVSGALFSESVQAAADIPVTFDEGYTSAETNLKKFTPLVIFAVSAYVFVKQLAANNMIGIILAGLSTVGSIAFIKYSWTTLTAMFG